MPLRAHLFAILASLLLAACSDHPATDAGVAVAAWATAEPGDVQRVLECAGVVRARDKAFIRVGSRIGGQISKMYVRSGQIVRKGQLLALIDDRELLDMRRQAQARLDRAVAEAERIEATLANRVDAERARLAGDKSIQEYNQQNLGRRKKLHDKGHLEGDKLDSASRDAKASDQSVAAGSSAVERTAREQKRELAKAKKAVEEAQALVDLADARISLTRIESPIEGIVGQVVSQAGEQVAAELQAVHILTVIDPRYLELWVYINEADIAGVRPGMPVRFFKPSQRERVMGAVVGRVSPASELIDGVRFYPGVAELGFDTALELRPEMNVQCFVLVDELKDVLSVPNDAVMSKGARRVVYVDDGKGRGIPVEPKFGLRGGQRVQVLEGLAPGQRVAVKLGN